MSVAAASRGRGVGRALLDELERWARAQPDLVRLELQVFSNNQAAIRLYERSGFVLEGTRRDAVRVGDIAVDLLLMAKTLR